MGQVNPAEDNKSEAKPRNCYLSAVNRRFCFFAEIKKQSSEAFLSAEASAKEEAKEGNYTTMPITKSQKEKILKELEERIAKQKAMVLVSVGGVKVKDLANFRRNLKKQNCEIKVAKKTLFKLALKKEKIDFDLKPLPGEVAMVFGYQDEISPAKLSYKFSKENEKFKMLGGFMENQLKSAEDIITLAQIPGREELLAKLVGSISAPVSNLVYSLQYNLRGLVYILSNTKPSI